MTEVICDNKKLVYSNRICCISKESLEVLVDFGDNANLKIIFKFNNDGKDTNTTGKSIDENTVEFTLHNYTSSLGAGLTDICEIGKLGDKKIYIIFYAYRLQDDAFPIIDLSIYMEK